MAQRVQHAAIRDANSVHECKQILASTTADAGKVITPSATEAGRGELRELKASELDWAGFQVPSTGWLMYSDSDATPANPVAILSGETKPFPVGENFTVLGRVPDDIPGLYDGASQKVVAYNGGDAYLIQVNMVINASVAGNVVVNFINSPSNNGMVFVVPFGVASANQIRTVTALVPVYADTVANGISITLTPDQDISIAYPEITVSLQSRG